MAGGTWHPSVLPLETRFAIIRQFSKIAREETKFYDPDSRHRRFENPTHDSRQTFSVDSRSTFERSQIDSIFRLLSYDCDRLKFSDLDETWSDDRAHDSYRSTIMDFRSDFFRARKLRNTTFLERLENERSYNPSWMLMFPLHITDDMSISCGRMSTP